MNPDRLLAESDRLLSDVVPGTVGLWPRACAWLIRLAVERALDDLWARRRPEVSAAPRRAQFLVLGTVLDEQAAARAEQLWVGLSRAGHHHAYELAPTAAELRRWHEQARWAVAEFQAAG